MRKKSISILSLVLLTPLVLLIGCGGDSGGTAEPAAPAGGSSPPASTNDLSMGTASISGTIRFDGQAPRLRPIAMDADPKCAAMHSDPVLDERVVLGDGNTLGNVLIVVKSGLASGTWAVPSEPIVLDQKGCKYVPHVLGIMAGQTLKILNSDGILHNVHALPKVNREFNQAMPASVTETEKVFARPEETFRVKCDVHPWMGAWITVLSHPFHATTGEDGTYTISGLPAGTYEIEAWHEVLKTMTATVTVADGGSETADFSFSRN